MAKRIAYTLTALVGLGTLALGYVVAWLPDLLDAEAVGTTAFLNLILAFALWSWGWWSDD